MADHISRDPERDPAMAAALRSIVGHAELGAARGELLEARIMAAASPQLVRLRERLARAGARPWWEWTAEWTRVAVPSGLAAAALAVVLARQPTQQASAAVGAVIERAVSERSVIGALASGRAAGVDSLVGPASRDWLLSAALVMEAPGDVPAPAPANPATDSGGAGVGAEPTAS
jgi:hypothetical protein